MSRENNLAEDVVETLRDANHLLALAESCTGGMVSERITSVPGASDVFEEAIISYSNDAKIRRLAVDPEVMSEHGAVSEEVAVEMVEGAYLVPDVTVAASITGIAGPTGGTDEKPVGTVCFALKEKHEPIVVTTRHFDGNRQSVREQSTRFILKSLQNRDVMLNENEE